jgi:hypothetical protein
MAIVGLSTPVVTSLSTPGIHVGEEYVYYVISNSMGVNISSGDIYEEDRQGEFFKILITSVVTYEDHFACYGITFNSDDYHTWDISTYNSAEKLLSFDLEENIFVYGLPFFFTYDGKIADYIPAIQNASYDPNYQTFSPISDGYGLKIIYQNDADDFFSISYSERGVLEKSQYYFSYTCGDLQFVDSGNVSLIVSNLGDQFVCMCNCNSTSSGSDLVRKEIGLNFIDFGGRLSILSFVGIGLCILYKRKHHS